jgi:hypothetical protein
MMTRPPRVAIMIVGMVLEQVVVALIFLAATTLFTAFHRMYHVWQMTGGEPAGWAPPREPFVAPGLIVEGLQGESEAGKIEE